MPGIRRRADKRCVIRIFGLKQHLPQVDKFCDMNLWGVRSVHSLSYNQHLMLDGCAPLLKLCSLFADTYDIEGVKLLRFEPARNF